MSDKPTSPGFAQLLALLGPAEQSAGAAYEALRERLIKFFEWRNCETPEELADEVFERVEAKLEGGEVIRRIHHYCAGVARIVALEHLRRRSARLPITEAALPATPAPADAFDETQNKRQACLTRCLAQLAPEMQELLLAYYDTDERTMIPARKRLAERLNISLNVLRIRVCRAKTKLESCVRRCCRE